MAPSTALWWLDHYGEFEQRLMQHYQVIAHQKDTCLIFALRTLVLLCAPVVTRNPMAQTVVSS